ncbi:hypothetical protein [Salmonirosea aquatica]|uniref:DUF4386 family protein n=1 Tax=Salmonirosea aquatica TaxID=2654236 RepID=A0A7C9BFW6_9BACT|nr:hypothetical protein [Cytophagaceae bacterium SJW1-29]
MSHRFEKNAGIALLAGSFLMIATMILHPAGGDLKHLIKIQKIIIVSHSLALLSIPFSFVGFLGLTRRLGTEHFLSLTAFSVMSFGLVAALGAAATNGLALPFFLQDYQEASPETLATVKIMVRYNFALNHAFDYILLGAMWLAILFWSVTALLTSKLHQAIGYLGLSLTLVAGILITAGYDFVSLQGFRLFVLGSVVWIALVGVAMIRSRTVRKE